MLSHSVRDVPAQVPHASGAVYVYKEFDAPLRSKKRIELAGAKTKKICWPVFMLLIALVVPWVIFIGPLRFSLYRIVLLVTILPCLGMWMLGKAGRIRIADIALLLFSFWCWLSLIVLHGAAVSIEPGGIRFIETVGPYMLARCYIRDADDFYNMIRLLFKIVLLLLPFAIFELVSGQNILHDLFAAAFPTFSYPPMPPRLGLTRVRSVFDHPILFGVFTGSIFALAHSVLGYQKSFLQRSLKTGLVGATSILSLSSGPIIAMVVLPGLLLSGDSLLRAIKISWKIAIGFFILAFLTVKLVADRSLPEIVASSFLTLDAWSYWFRRVIWEYGSASALNHPLFGVGLSEWERPAWMPSSIDNLFLYFAVKHGLPASFFLLLAFLSIFVGVGLKKGLDSRATSYRTGFLITMTGLFLVGWTVFFWDASYVLFVFLMGSGLWILDIEGRNTGSRATGQEEARPLRAACLKRQR